MRTSCATLVASLFVVSACAPATRAPESSGADLDVAGMDPSVPPDESFYRYANGGWLDRTEIPPDRSTWGIGSVVQLRTDERIRTLIEEAAQGNSTDPTARKVGDYFASFMDEQAIEERGARPLQPELQRIAAIANRKQLAAYLGASLRADVDMINSTDIYTPNLLGLWVAQDFRDPRRYSPFLIQGGLDMPDREYYLSDSPKMAEARAEFSAHVARVLKLAGLQDAEARAQRVAVLERKIAQAHVSRMETDDVRRGGTHWPAKAFAARAPGLDWAAFFGAAGLSGQSQFVVWQPEAVTALSKLVRGEPLESWKDWAAFHAADAMSGFLPKAFVEEHFAFHDKVLNGTPELRARWKRGVDYTGDALGEPVGRLYVEKHFPAADKAAVEQMVRDLIAAFGRRVETLAWMSPKTKERAKAKLAVLYVGVGYPDRWKDYGGLSIERGDAYGNEERANLFRYRQSLDKLGTPVDRTEWCMNPQLVNAVNLPAMNAMNFPAAMLQPPYFDSRRPASMNYGAIGSVIGHEISHSFDDQGALFDAAGRLENWWSDEDFAHFTAAGKQLVAQYDAYKPLPDVPIKGELVLGENIADLAGLAAAHDAWQRSLGGKPAPEVQGFTGAQQFFIGYAQSWRRKYREPALRQRLLTDGHSPSEWRVATVRNLDPWYEAFAIAPPGHALYLKPEDRVRIW